MVNHDNSKIISAINSREVTDIKKWLQQYKNLKVVSRDGSNIYKLAIELANPNIIQVSDRFHLIKGLSEAIREEIKEILPRKIVVDEIKENIPKKTIKERYEKTKEEIKNGEKITIACKNNSIDIRTFKKLILLNDEELTEHFKDKYIENRHANLDRKNREIKLMRDLYNKGMTISAISKQTGYDWRTIRKYVKSKDILTVENTKRERYTLCTPFHDKISELVIGNLKIKSIYIEINKLGYQGKYGTLKKYISNLKNEERLTYKKMLSRKDLLKLLYNPMNKNKELNREILMVIYKKYPTVKKLIELMYEFKGILLKNKSEKALSVWFNKAEKIESARINSFTKGCYNDMPAIVNSIRYQYSNGITEASVNKIKLVKRIMHGRCSFELLKSKTLRLEFI
jgi:transposase